MNLKKFSTCKKSTACGTAQPSTSSIPNNKGPWTEQEDKKLINLVETYGAEKWSFISSHFPERIGKQCRERWFNHLCPTVNKTAWSKEEEWILFILHNKIGNKWSQLCKYLPGRTDNTIKNHWNSTMKKRVDNLQGEYDNMISGKNKEEIEQIQKDILDRCKTIVEQENQKFYNEKMKNYEKFKNITIDNKQSMYKLKKILLFRTHSKKIKRRGRKKKAILGDEKTTSSIKNYINTTNNKVNTDNNSIYKIMKNSQIKTSKSKKEKNKKKKFGTPKTKKIKRKIEDIFIDENKQYNKNINIISSPIHKFIITKQDLKDSRKKNGNSNISINNNINIINNINNENPILLSNCHNINSESAPAPVSYNNNFFVYTNPIKINNSIYNNILQSHNHKRKIKLELDEKNNIKDLSLLTPLKMNENETPNFNITETNKIFYKNDSNNALEKSAFNKPSFGEINYPYSNIKTHLYFSSSIKKPIQIISEEKNQNNINNMGSQNNRDNLINNNEINPNMENITPNKIIDDSEKKGSNIILKFNNNLIYNSSNKSKDCLNLNSSGLNMNLNNSYGVFSPDKNLTPFKVSNTNLDKMFFSNLNSKNDK